MTIYDLMQLGLNELVTKKEESPETASFECNQMLEHLFDFSHFQLLMNRNKDVTPEQAEKFENMLKQRCTGYPLQYLLGEWDFYGLTFQVGEGVLIPRSDTEVLVDAALSALSRVESPVVADLCSGSGCIAISIGTKRPDAKVYAVELSEEALPYLRANLERHPCQMTVVAHDVLSWEPPDCLDAVLSNPPYLTQTEMEKLQAEVAYEPKLALEAGEDGLLFYRGIATQYKTYLRPGGSLLFEVGYRQAASVAQILENNGYVDIAIQKDLAGISRVVSGKKPLGKNKPVVMENDVQNHSTGLPRFHEKTRKG